jgi:hypothetical protein
MFMDGSKQYSNRRFNRFNKKIYGSVHHSLGDPTPQKMASAVCMYTYLLYWTRQQ